MFSKSYKLKSTNTLKNTEKKHLSQRILESFAAATEEKVKELVSVKSNSNCLKLILHSGNVVSVYTVENIPIMIDLDGFLVPTVCALWKVPDLVPVLTIHAPVLTKVAAGAPLYAPGVELPSGAVLAGGFPMFGRGAPLAARTSDNAAAALVGRARLSSGDLLLATGGVVLDTIHVFGDLLCKEPKFAKIERPHLGPPPDPQHLSADAIASDIEQLSIKSLPKEEWPQLGRSAPRPEPPPCAPTPALIREPPSAPSPPATPPPPCEGEEGAPSPPEDMDGLLEWCLLSCLRAEGRGLQLPLATNLLYRRHMVAQCPVGRTLDVKRSSHKKMSRFLEAMQREGVLEVREVERGVDAVTAVAWAHPRLRSHRGGREAAPVQRDADASPDYRPPAVSELHCVTAALKAVLPHKKGTALQAREVRAALAQYVRERGLAAGSGVRLDEPLAALLGRQPTECVPWESVMSAALGAMTPCTEVRFADGTVTRTKSRLQPVRMSVVTRSGNKKVTLVSNLQPFGFELHALGRACQTGAAAACVVTRTAGASADQLLLQGDQTRFMAKLLTVTYGLPAKFVEGADKALAKKK